MSNQNFQRFKDALRYELLHYESVNGAKGKNVKKGEALKHLARSLIDMAINSSMDSQKMVAIKELIDRLDGKPMQSIGGVEGEPITVVERVIVQRSEDKQIIDVTPQAENNPKSLN